MKAIQYVLAGALLFGAWVPTMAQDDNKAAIESATQIIKAKGPDYKDQVKDIYKANKKNPEVLVALGKVFLAQKDTANAKAFAQYALAKNMKYAKAFLLLGDIAVTCDDAGAAAQNYQQAIYFDPKDPEAYYKYAMILRGRSPQEAVSTLESLRQQRPDYPVDALCGRIYYFSQDYQGAEKYYDQVPDKSKMEDEDITNYAMTTWLLGHRDKSIEVCKTGLARDARRAGWNRIAFYNYTDLKKTDEALAYADKLFHQSDSAHYISEDYVYYGTALQQAKRYDEAIKAFDEALEMDKNNKKQLGIVYKNLSDLYMAKGDYDNALSYLEKSIDCKDSKSMDDLDNLGSLYADIASKKKAAKDEAGAVEAFKKADAVYGDIMTKYPNYKNYCNYMRGQINANLDPDSKQGLAKPYYEALASSLESKAEMNTSEKQMIKQAYLYLLVYEYSVKHNIAGAKVFANKLLVVDPENETAKQVIALK